MKVDFSQARLSIFIRNYECSHFKNIEDKSVCVL